MMFYNSQALFNERLAGGLRIREIGKGETENSIQKASRKAGFATGETAKAQPAVTASLSDVGKFACEFLRRCQASKLGDEESAKFLTESLINTAKEISKRLGKEKADEFLSDILAYTERSLTENRLSGAIIGFFGKFRQEAIKDKALASKIVEVVNTFNIGLDVLINKDKMLPERVAEGRPPGLSFAINNFFSTDYTVTENKGCVTAKGFTYFNGAVDRIDVPHPRELEWREDGPAGPGYYSVGDYKTGEKLTIGELVNDGSLFKAAEYLRTEIGNEKAAAALHNLTAEANVMEAIAATIAIVAVENGVDPAIDYVRHLNGAMKSAIHSTAMREMIMFDGWILHAQGKTSKTVDSGITLHSSEVEDIANKGHLALDWSWECANGGGIIMRPRDLNALYSSLV